MQLHWPPIAECIKFKIVFFFSTFKGLHELCPSYMKELLTLYCPAHMLRSLSSSLLARTDYNMRTYGARAFAISATELWNQLSDDIKSIANLTTFKSKLKTCFLILVSSIIIIISFYLNFIFFIFIFYNCVNIV